MTNTGSYTWGETEGSSTVPQDCALGPAMGIAMEDALAERECKMFGEWEPPDVDNCITIVSRQFLDFQESITTVRHTSEHKQEIIDRTLYIVDTIV